MLSRLPAGSGPRQLRRLRIRRTALQIGMDHIAQHHAIEEEARCASTLPAQDARKIWFG